MKNKHKRSNDNQLDESFVFFFNWLQKRRWLIAAFIFFWGTVAVAVIDVLGAMKLLP